MLEWLSNTHTWTALLQIIGINIVLSGDNAVVIALASRSLPPVRQRQAILFGTVGAIVLRVLLTGFAAVMLQQPYLKLIGGLLLLWIAVKLLLPEDEDGDVAAHASMIAAIKTIIIADFVMSLDNVLGVAAVANGDLTLLILGLLISMPLIIYGSTLILKLMDRFPVFIALGAALLGYVAGEMSITDQIVAPWVESDAPFMHTALPILTAAAVVVAGRWMALRRANQTTADEADGQTPRS